MLLGMFFLIVGFSNVVFASTITVNITNNTVGGFFDADVYETQPSHNTGIFPYIGSNWYTDNSYRTYVKINLTSLTTLTSPNDITQATYCTYVYSTSGTRSRNITALFVNDTNWIEGTNGDSSDCRYSNCGGGIVWNDAGKINVSYCTMQPCGNVTGTPNGTCVNLDYNFTTITGSGVWKCFNVTNSARNYDSTKKVFSILLTAEINNSAEFDSLKLFTAKESTLAIYPSPYLTISYNLPLIKKNLLITGGHGFLKMFGLKMLW